MKTAFFRSSLLVPSATVFCGLTMLVMPVRAAVDAANPLPPAVMESTNKPVRFSRGIDDVVKMLDAGVAKEVVKTYVDISPIPFRPSAEEIIALNQHGVPSDIVNAMILRGAMLRSQPTPAQPVVQTAPAPAPAQTTPATPDYFYVYPGPATAPAYTPAYEPSYPYVETYPTYVGYPYYYPTYNYVSVGLGWPLYYNYGCGPYRGNYRGRYSTGLRYNIGAPFGGSLHYGNSPRWGGGLRSGGTVHYGTTFTAGPSLRGRSGSSPFSILGGVSTGVRGVRTGVSRHR